jgi:mono/diheme cytochrome c family protein
MRGWRTEVGIPTVVRIKAGVLNRLGIYAARHQHRRVALIASEGLPGDLRRPPARAQSEKPRFLRASAATRPGLPRPREGAGGARQPFNPCVIPIRYSCRRVQHGSPCRRAPERFPKNGAVAVKRPLIQVSLGLLGLLVLAAAGFSAAVHTRWDRTFHAPEPELGASADPELIERGRYLVYGPAHCSYCHTPSSEWPRLDAGEERPLVGGYAFHLPIGVLRTPNITPDPETGIGRYSDGQLARVLRHGVRPDGRVAFPVMEFQKLSDEDLVAVLSYLRSAEPVHNPVPDHEWNAVGKGLLAFALRPTGPAGAPPAASPAGLSIERGSYLAGSVANCAGCHSPRNLMDGSYTGPRFSGGVMDVDGQPDLVFGVPNLTPDPKTGHIRNWTEDVFVARFRAGPAHEGSHMPWNAYARMSDDDLRSIYRFLMSLEPVENATGPILRPRKAR